MCSSVNNLPVVLRPYQGELINYSTGGNGTRILIQRDRDGQNEPTSTLTMTLFHIIPACWFSKHVCEPHAVTNYPSNQWQKTAIKRKGV